MKFSDIKRRKLSFFNNSNNNKNRHNAATNDKGNPETGESSTGRPASAPAGTTSPAIRSQLQAAFATPTAASTPPRNSLPTGRGSSCDSSPTSSIGDAYEQGRK